MSRVVAVLGARITLPERCEECGLVPTAADTVEYVVEWNKLADRCSFCGRAIMVASATLKHVHSPEKSAWDAWPESEGHLEWYATGPFGAVDIHAHSACVKRCTLRGPKEWAPPWMGLETEALPCDVCGTVASEDDIRTVVRRLYSLRPGPCVYCGRRIRLERITVWHKSLDGRHIGRWHFKDWRWEPRLDWMDYASDGRVEFPGHLACARRAMRYARWEPPRSLCPVGTGGR